MSVLEGLLEWVRGLFGGGADRSDDGEDAADPTRLDPDNVTTHRSEADSDAAEKLASLRGDESDTEDSDD